MLAEAFRILVRIVSSATLVTLCRALVFGTYRILVRIVLSATSRFRYGEPLASASYSILVRIVLSATGAKIIICDIHGALQYPHPDRYLCYTCLLRN